MAYIDSSTGELVLHVVYDGPPNAGKTTNVQALHHGLLSSREGSVESPGSTGRRTEFFDIREFHAGRLGEFTLRCRLLSVPGQPDRMRRRRFLLERADVVVFVVDPDTTRIGEQRAMVRSLAKVLVAADVPLVIQLNKLDVAGEFTPDAILESLRLDPSTPCLGARARDGFAVAETFLLAAKEATGRAKRLLERNAIERLAHPRTADEWLAALVEHDQGDVRS